MYNVRQYSKRFKVKGKLYEWKSNIKDRKLQLSMSIRTPPQKKYSFFSLIQQSFFKVEFDFSKQSSEIIWLHRLFKFEGNVKE